MAFLDKHAILEKSPTLLLTASLLVVTIGGIVEIAPLFWLKNTIEDVEGVRPYSPLELTGRDIYIREGCYTCHSQMIRPMRDEVERYGHYSLAAESKYDHPHQWGSKRTGPDVARVGGRYSDTWHVDHLMDPQSVVPESIMPKYAFLADAKIDGEHIEALLKTHRFVGVPYTDEQIASASADFKVQVDPDEDWDGLVERYPGAVVSNFDGILADPWHHGRFLHLYTRRKPIGCTDGYLFTPERNCRQLGLAGNVLLLHWHGDLGVFT
jgi:cytochrome c oxidase cbb3-type subunit 2